MKVKYIGTYEGTVPWCGITVKPGDEVEVSDEVGKQLLTTGQFVEVKGGE